MSTPKTAAALSQTLENKRESLFKVEIVILACLLVIAVIVTQRLAFRPDEDSAPVTLLTVPGLSAAATWEVASASPGLVVQQQDTAPFRSNSWAVRTQIFAPNTDKEGWIEFKMPAPGKGRYQVAAYVTKASDYGVIQASIGGQPVGAPIDLFERRVTPFGPVDLGAVDIQESPLVLRFSVVGHNDNSLAPLYQFGIQGLTFTAL